MIRDEVPDKELYLIACLRHKSVYGNDFILFWGPDNSGYATNLYQAGIYTKEQVDRICDHDDIPFPLSFLKLLPEELQKPNKNVWRVVLYNNETRRWIKQQVTKYKIKCRLKVRHAV